MGKVPQHSMADPSVDKYLETVGSTGWELAGTLTLPLPVLFFKRRKE